jgi:type IV pilus biogenesis protein CpaD/CtpE
MSSFISLTARIVLIAGLSGCAITDPLLNERSWEPTGANEKNIAAEVANPMDLVRGREPIGGSDGELASAAILRLRTGHVKALPDSGISGLQIQAGPAPAGGS